MKQTEIKGIVLLLLATTSWGIQFPLSKAALGVVDAFYMTAIRYGMAVFLFLCVLACVEGRRALRLEGQGWHLFAFGSIGFCGYNLLGFIGVGFTSPEHASIIMALMPLMTLLVRWVLRGERPAGFTLGCVAVALAGVGLVITKGSGIEVLASGAGWGDLLMVLAVSCWVIYMMGAERYAGWSSLRFTALSCSLGWLSMVAVTCIATAVGAAHVPSAFELGSVGWEMAYMTLLTAFLAALCWNTGSKRLGAINSILFMNFVPVTAFSIGLLQGQRFTGAELAGAALVIAALVANNLFLRRKGHDAAAVSSAAGAGDEAGFPLAAGLRPHAGALRA